MSITLAATCLINFNIICNGLTLGVPQGYGDRPYGETTSNRPTASEDQKALANHINARIWAGKGTLPAILAPKLTCQHINMHYDCYNTSIDTAEDNYQVDDFEYGLMIKIWGPLFGAAPPPVITIQPHPPATGVPNTP